MLSFTPFGVDCKKYVAMVRLKDQIDAVKRNSSLASNSGIKGYKGETKNANTSVVDHIITAYRDTDVT